jgi:cytochrome P450
MTKCIAVNKRQKNGPNFEKSPIFIGAVSPMDGQTGISLAPNEVHTRQPRALAHVFTNTALLQQQDIMRSHVDKLVEQMKKLSAENLPVNFSNWCK